MDGSLRILIVEDEIMIAMGLELGLKKSGIMVCKRVVTGEDAVRAALQERPDCILMDIQLAGDIDGIDAALQIQTRVEIPIIFLSGFPNKDIEERAMKAHPLGFFTKPVTVPVLLPLLDSIEKNV